MRPLALRIALTLLAILGLAVLLQQVQRRRALAEIARVHDYRSVLIGDSHGDDIVWEGRPRLTNPAQDLYSALKHLEAILETRSEDSRLEAVVLTVWPNKFSPLATRRLSGIPQEDGWDVQALGKVAPLFTWSDLWRDEGPLRYRLRSAVHTLQQRPIHVRFDQDCFAESVQPNYRRGHTYEFNDTYWWPTSTGTQKILRRFIDEARRVGLRVILVENPLPDHYLEQIDPASHQDYKAFMAELEDLDGVKFLALGHEPSPYDLFRDWHHLTCKGEQYVWERLEPLLPESP